MNARRLFVSVVGAGALLVILALGLFGSIAGAQTPPAASQPQVVHIVGHVDAVSASSITLTTPRGTVTANVGPNTWVVVQKDGRCVEGVLSDIQAGKRASVQGTTTDRQGVINARVVMQDGCAAPGRGQAQGPRGNAGERDKGQGKAAPHGAMGTIKAISGNTITVTTPRGQDVSVVTNASTVVINDGFKAVNTLKVGDAIAVHGNPARGQEKQTARTLNAWAIRVVTDATEIVMGRVESVNGNVITLKTPRQREGLQVTLDASTGYRSTQITDGNVSLVNATQADVKVGSHLMVEGVPSADGKSMTAKAVILMPEGKGRAKARP